MTYGEKLSLENLIKIQSKRLDKFNELFKINKGKTNDLKLRLCDAIVAIKRLYVGYPYNCALSPVREKRVIDFLEKEFAEEEAEQQKELEQQLREV